MGVRQHVVQDTQNRLCIIPMQLYNTEDRINMISMHKSLTNLKQVMNILGACKVIKSSLTIFDSAPKCGNVGVISHQMENVHVYLYAVFSPEF